MFSTKVKIAWAVIGGLGLACAIAPPLAPLAAQPPATQDTEPAPAGPELIGVKIEAAANDTPELTLMKQKYQCVQRELELRYAQYRVGRGTLDVLLESNHRLRDSELELATTPPDRVRALKRSLVFTTGIFEINKARFAVGALKQQDLEQTRFEMLYAELRLLREEKGAGKAGK